MRNLLTKLLTSIMSLYGLSHKCFLSTSYSTAYILGLSLPKVFLLLKVKLSSYIKLLNSQLDLLKYNFSLSFNPGGTITQGLKDFLALLVLRREVRVT